MALKGYLQTAYQNALNLDDISIADYHKKEIHFPFVKMKIFANNLQLINRLHKEGKMNKDKAAGYIESQKKNIRTMLMGVKNLNVHELENIVERTVKNIIEL